MSLVIFIMLSLSMFGSGLMCLGVAIWIWRDSEYDRNALACVIILSALLLSMLPFAACIGLIADVIAQP